MKPQPRTNPQNNALHLFFEQVAEALNDSGLELKEVLEMDIPWTKGLVKELLWRRAQKMVLKKESTKELQKIKDIETVYEIVNRALAKRGIHVEFPSQESLLEKAELHYKN